MATYRIQSVIRDDKTRFIIQKWSWISKNGICIWENHVWDGLFSPYSEFLFPDTYDSLEKAQNKVNEFIYKDNHYTKNGFYYIIG